MSKKKELTSEELHAVRVCPRPTTVITATGSIDTNEEATMFMKDLDMFVTIQLLEDTPAFVSLGKLC